VSVLRGAKKYRRTGSNALTNVFRYGNPAEPRKIYRQTSGERAGNEQKNQALQA